MRRDGRFVLGLWLAFVCACLVLAGRATFTADFSAFLPDAPTPEQQLLVDQLKSGVASRLILVGIEGGGSDARARASRALAARLRADPRFLHVANGESVGLERDRQLLFDYRYVLSPEVRPERFQQEALADALVEGIDALTGLTGLLGKALFVRDPTGEFLRVLEGVGGESRPLSADGVWVSRDGGRALLLVRTRAEGSDTDGQEDAVNTLRASFRDLAEPGLALVMTGPGPFSVSARASIKADVTRLSGIGALIILGLLWLVYRSSTALFLGLLPVLSGALAGVAAVSLGFGSIHGVTLGFGTALIGEAVDYSIYLLLQSEAGNQEGGQAEPGPEESTWIKGFWPTIRIGVLTSVFGFASLLFSGFPGLAQLGLYAIAGLLTAAAVTRFVLPRLLPPGLRLRDTTGFGARLHVGLPSLRRLRWPLFGLFVAALAFLASERHTMWNRELAALSPVPAADVALDMTLRADLGAPDVGHMVVIAAADADAALAASERVAERLRGLVEQGEIASFEAPSNFLPSQTEQRRRLTSLPEPGELRRRFQDAVQGLPVRAERFEPFFDDVAAARARAPLTRAGLEGTALGQGLDALLVESKVGWTALLPLRASVAKGLRIDAGKVRAALATTGLAGVHFVDIKGESDRLYADYLSEAVQFSLAGLLAIVVLLALVTRSLVRVLRIGLPLIMAVVIVAAGLVLVGYRLSLLHLVGMLLIIAVGSNYALFFDRASVEGGIIAPRTLVSLTLAVATTVAGFGMLAFSSVPVLYAMGMTVGPGAVLALLFAAILTPRA